MSQHRGYNGGPGQGGDPLLGPLPPFPAGAHAARMDPRRNISQNISASVAHLAPGLAPLPQHPFGGEYPPPYYGGEFQAQLPADFPVVAHGSPTTPDPEVLKMLRSNVPPLDPRKYKTQLCRNLLRTGICNYGDACGFAHSLAEMRQDSQMLSILRHLTVPKGAKGPQAAGSEAYGEPMGFAAGQPGYGSVAADGGIYAAPLSAHVSDEKEKHNEGSHTTRSMDEESAHRSHGTSGSDHHKPSGKTQLCRNILRLGHCDLGDACAFAHSVSELRADGLTNPPHRLGTDAMSGDVEPGSHGVPAADPAGEGSATLPSRVESLELEVAILRQTLQTLVEELRLRAVENGGQLQRGPSAGSGQGSV
eukprot:RCo017435